MRIALLIPPRDFRDETVSSAKLILEKWGIPPTIVGLTAGVCFGTHGASYKPETNISKLNPEEFDALVLVDGVGVDSYKLYDQRPLLDLVKRFVMSKKVIAAMGNSVKIIARANAINDTRVAAPEDEETQRLIRIYRGIASLNPTEFDKNILTAKDSESTEQVITTLLDKIGAK